MIGIKIIAIVWAIAILIYGWGLFRKSLDIKGSAESSTLFVLSMTCDTIAFVIIAVVLSLSGDV